MIYRFVRIVIGGDPGRAVTVEHECDKDALAQAQTFGAGRAVEVWCGDRQPATVLPSRGLTDSVNRPS